MITTDLESDLDRERKMKKEDKTLLKKIIIYITLATILNIPSFLSSDISSSRRWFPDVWKCKNCGYENYEGISKCAVCGTTKR